MTDANDKPAFPWLKYFVPLERLCAWILLFVIIAFGVTGYGMTKGLVPKDIARSLHLGWLGTAILVPFIIHTSWGIRLSLGRRNLWNRAAKIILVVLYAALVMFFIWAEFFYAAGKSERQAVERPTATVFTAETLKAYDGLGGRPAYAAVDGVVYDFSGTFVNGLHKGHRAGQDLSAEFHGAHADDYLKGLPVVGSYE